MEDKQALLWRFLAALAHRTQKALHDVPFGFGTFKAGEDGRLLIFMLHQGMKLKLSV